MKLDSLSLVLAVLGKQHLFTLENCCVNTK